ncbi:MAG: hypothetical protein GEU79_10090 [Acidimicrobiia bacterium]|nr:hypothetical protein [Acidimicrobiia bacterium]
MNNSSADSTPERIVLVANPVASQFTGGDHRMVRAILERRYEVEALWPTSAEHAREIVETRVSAGVAGVVAMGGDGVVHQIAQALVGTKVFLGIIPVGTTNVFSRLLGIPDKATKAAEVIIDAQTTTSQATVRVGYIGEAMQAGERHAIFATGVGLDAEVVAAAETDPHRKLRFGSIHYATTTIGVLWRAYRGERRQFTVTADGRSVQGAAVFAQFRPVYTYFGRVALRVDGEMPDPMTLLIMETVRLRRLPSIGFKLLAGSDLGEVAEFHTWSGISSARVTSDHSVYLQADGELLGRADQVSFDFVSDSIRVVAPEPKGGWYVRLRHRMGEWATRYLPRRTAR